MSEMSTTGVLGASSEKRALVALFAGSCGIAFAVPVLWTWLAIGDTMGGGDNRPRRRPSSARE